MLCSRFVKDQKFQHPQEGLNCMQEIHNSNHAFVTLIWACCKVNYMLILNLIFASNLFELIPRKSLWEANLVLLFQNSRYSLLVCKKFMLVIACISGCSYTFLKYFCLMKIKLVNIDNFSRFSHVLSLKTISMRSTW